MKNLDSINSLDSIESTLYLKPYFIALKQDLEAFKKTKNLLAFSGGVDSTALFFILLYFDINFDIAIINYKIRKSSELEISRAKNLAYLYNKKIFTINAPKFEKNFEKNARDFRYSFFSKIIEQNAYNTLFTAHQLNDNFEWFLMQILRGGSILNSLIKRNKIYKNYEIFRPLLNISKAEILDFLKQNNIFYFEDFSNQNKKFMRNEIRADFTENAMHNHSNNIKFFLEQIANLNNKNEIEIKNFDGFYLIESNIESEIQSNLDSILNSINLCAKKLNYLLSREQNYELSKNLKTNKDFSLAFGNKIAIEKSAARIFISPFLNIDSIKLTKEQKENFRAKKIPPKLRRFLAQNNLKNNLIF